MYTFFFKSGEHKSFPKTTQRDYHPMTNMKQQHSRTKKPSQAKIRHNL